jgi:hypothetical protein
VAAGAKDGNDVIGVLFCFKVDQIRRMAQHSQRGRGEDGSF